MMEQSFLEKIFKNYDHLKGRYLGCFCKDEMDNLSKAIRTNYSLYERVFVLINIGNKESNREHWMGVVMNKCTNTAGYLNSFGRGFLWLMDVLKNTLIMFIKQNMLYNLLPLRRAAYILYT